METEEDFTAAIEEDGDNPELHLKFARFLWEKGRFQDAEHEFETALAIDGDNAEGHLDLARLYLEKEFYLPQYATIHIMKAYELLDRFEDGGEAFYETLEEHFRLLEVMHFDEELPGDARALAAVLLGRMNLQMGILDDAAKWFYAFLELQDALPDAVREARDGIERIEESVEETLKDKTIDNETRAEALYTRGILRYNQGEADSAWTLIKAARNFAPPDTEVYMKATLYYIQLVMEKRDRTREETEEALALCDELLDYDLDDELKEIVASFKGELG
ncbi:MAG: tetratricopeptide repeat protein [Euryarchaeota archaeon]|nr:tetratricopeptide repeat protein [Euryarchaeota archaeon]